ncbi:MAG: SDR family NAD(P)-dependent oxidoreductase [Paucibacter sp.]|nr:SDR family NAD(P)-dependent oxidoreductase [Roseateles sp.]
MKISDFKDKIVVITGAGSGIGRSTALAFARQGAHVVATDIAEQALMAVERDITALGARCLAQRVDVSNADDMRSFADRVRRDVGIPHVIVNNAGVAYLGRFIDSDLEHWRRLMDINVMGVVHGCHFFLPMMISAGGPRRMINVASSAANFPSPSMAAYAASKYAVAGFSEVLKMELSETGIGVITVCPGVINTPIAKPSGRNTAPTFTPEQIDRLQNYYASEGCSPDRVAEAIVRAARRGGDIVLVGPYARLVYHARRLSLRLARKLMLDGARRIGLF